METVSYKCINCDAPLQFDPKQQKFVCEFCRSEFAETELTDYFSKLEKKLDQEHKKEPEQVSDDDFSSYAAVYVCQSCGAEVITEKNTAATFCVFCHNPVMISNRMAGNFKPNRVIPFMISEQDAKQKFLDFCAKKKFLPKDFVSGAQLDMMKGVYYPYWLVDSLKIGGIRATAKKKRTWREGDFEFEETKIYRVIRNGTIDFRDYPHTALKSDENLKALKYVNPYDDKDYRPFMMSYLSGFLAEKRDLERQDVQNEVDNELADYAKRIYSDSISGYDSVSIDDMRLSTRRESWDYALLPVWLMTFDYNGQKYLYAMNGQTGKNFGELPIDKKKLAAFGIGMFIGLLLICLLGGYFLL